MGKCGYDARSVFFLGFGQGGMAALGFVSSSSSSSSSEQALEFGGVISIGGRLPSSCLTEGKGTKNRTSVLICGGARSTQVTRSAVDGLKRVFADVEYVKWEKGEDSMPRNREEMMPVMRFFARRLRSRAGVPEGAVEIS